VVFLAGGAWWAIHNPVIALVAVALGGLGVLSVRSPRVGELIDSIFARYWRAMGWMAAVVGPLFIARALSDVVADSPLIVALVLLLMWFAFFSFAVRSLSSEPRRERLWKSLSRIGRAAPFVYAFVLAGLAITLFATLAYVLADRDVIRFGIDQSAAQVLTEPADALDLFSWHMLDAIPGLAITDTLRWDEPLDYDDAGVGLLVLVFKVVAVTPIVAAFVSFWRHYRKPAASAA
jgi:hypothetical protein